ncbi:hypothetical protein Cgig2_005189 [Carnegiea gigantea]|uniref:E3 ubiquitin-protein ligase CHFR cysteine rich domain-containing protein n=1 Tax=Carnegiea gigantea TaxID=171969 RepID=A0A9Q1KEY1_9CARY|nr:hypothetical protein Cgig2_005189 [Carnegiea gigantea]
MEVGQSSGSNPSDEVWAKLVPSNSSYESIEISSSDIMITSQVTSTLHKLEWCQIVRNSDRCSATITNKSSHVILVDGAVLQSEEAVGIKCGSEIVPASVRQGNISYKFEVMPVQEECPGKKLKDILQADPALQRSEDELAALDSYASIKSNLVITNGKRSRRKRARSPIPITRSPIPFYEEGDDNELPCRQCGTPFGGFRCSENTVHLQCYACGGMMPIRSDTSIPQHCLGCNQAFCGAYWHAQGVLVADHYPVCSIDTFKPISERQVSAIPSVAHGRNQFEQDITDRCIRKLGKTLQDVVSEWVAKFNNREIVNIVRTMYFLGPDMFTDLGAHLFAFCIQCLACVDRTTMPLSHAVMITAGTHLCNDCYDKLVSFLLYWFRISLPNHMLPPEASNREDCWYGYACRTQHHSVEHARKRNHVCRPTRGSQM